MKAFIAAVAVIIFSVLTETEGAYVPAPNPQNLAALPPGQVYCFKSSLSCTGNVVVASFFECCKIQGGYTYFDPEVKICQSW